MRILIAEDEKEIARALQLMLEKQRYAVDCVHTGTDALAYLLSEGYDAVCLDIMMPEMDGLSVLKAMRERGIATPVLLLTAKAELDDRVEGLDAGADDYLSKPFAMREFLARIKALLRRSGSYTDELLSFGSIKLDCGGYTLSKAPREARLNNKEFQLMELFMRNPRHVFSTTQLMERIWGYECEAELNVVWTNIANLRKKLRELDADILIKTMRGAGFALYEGGNAEDKATC